MELFVLDHHPNAGPYRFQELLDSRAATAPHRSIDVPGGEALPEDLDEVAGIVVMGSPRSVTEEPDWLAGELALLRAAVDADVPVFGVCFGAQALAVATGGEVTTREVPEIGFVPQHRTDEAAADDLAGGWPDGAATFIWHGDDVTLLPPDSVPLLQGPQQITAWRIGSAFATQAHPEVDAARIEAWSALPELTDQLHAAGTDPEALLEEARRREPFVLAAGLSLFGRFLDGPVRRRATGSSR